MGLFSAPEPPEIITPAQPTRPTVPQRGQQETRQAAEEERRRNRRRRGRGALYAQGWSLWFLDPENPDEGGLGGDRVGRRSLLGGG